MREMLLWLPLGAAKMQELVRRFFSCYFNSSRIKMLGSLPSCSGQMSLDTGWPDPAAAYRKVGRGNGSQATFVSLLPWE